ncbi:MAG: hypothetical protein NZ805_09740 [Armatimonadetes bacterium]|nr:hypothetical protein [Armatimonadota bacterium]MDW8029428.1 hypothetical protein [Armatimonadota bacterium]
MQKFKRLNLLLVVPLLLWSKTALGNPIILTPLDITMPEMTFVRVITLGLANYGLDLLVLLFVLDWFGILSEMTMKEVLKYNLWVCLGGWIADLVGYWLVSSVEIKGLLAGFRFVVATSIFAGVLILFWNFFLARWLLDFDLDEAFRVGMVFAIFTTPWSLALALSFGDLCFALLVAITAYKLCKTAPPEGKRLLIKSRIAVIVSAFIYWFVIMALSDGGKDWLEPIRSMVEEETL